MVQPSLQNHVNKLLPQRLPPTKSPLSSPTPSFYPTEGPRTTGQSPLFLVLKS